MIVIAQKRDIAAYIETAEELKETREELGDDWEEVAAELVNLIVCEETPDYGTDWEAWFKENLEDLTEEAIEIVA